LAGLNARGAQPGFDERVAAATRQGAGAAQLLSCRARPGLPASSCSRGAPRWFWRVQYRAWLSALQHQASTSVNPILRALARHHHQHPLTPLSTAAGHQQGRSPGEQRFPELLEPQDTVERLPASCHGSPVQPRHGEPEAPPSPNEHVQSQQSVDSALNSLSQGREDASSSSDRQDLATFWRAAGPPIRSNPFFGSVRPPLSDFAQGLELGLCDRSGGKPKLAPSPAPPSVPGPANSSQQPRWAFAKAGVTGPQPRHCTDVCPAPRCLSISVPVIEKEQIGSAAAPLD